MFPINNISENSFVTTSNVSVNIEDIFSDFTEGNLLKKCRLCFNSVESEYKLTKITKHYKSLISNMLEIQFIPTSRTSDFLCQSCVFNIRNFYRFKIKMREKQLSLKNFLIFNNELTKSNESNSTNDSNSVFIKTEPEEIPSVLSPPTAELFSESLLNDHPFEGEFKTESPSDETTGNGINSASDKRHSIDLSKIFPSNEKYQRIIGVCLENPHYSVNMISNLIGIPRSTVGFVIRKYKKSIASNNDQSNEENNGRGQRGASRFLDPKIVEKDGGIFVAYVASEYPNKVISSEDKLKVMVVMSKAYGEGKDEMKKRKITQVEIQAVSGILIMKEKNVKSAGWNELIFKQQNWPKILGYDIICSPARDINVCPAFMLIVPRTELTWKETISIIQRNNKKTFTTKDWMLTVALEDRSQFKGPQKFIFISNGDINEFMMEKKTVKIKFPPFNPATVRKIHIGGNNPNIYAINLGVKSDTEKAEEEKEKKKRMLEEYEKNFGGPGKNFALILQLNAGKRKSAFDELQMKCGNDSIDILLIQEPAMHKGKVNNIANGDLFYMKKAQNRVMSCIWIKRNSNKFLDPFLLTEFSDELMTAITVKVKLDGGSIKTIVVISFYSPGIPRSTVGFVIRKYKSIASNNDQLRENCEYSASQIYEDLSRDEQYYIAKELKIENFKCDDCDESFCTRNQVKQHSLVHHIKPKPDSSDAMPKHEKVHMLKNEIKSASDNKKMVDPSEIFPGNANHQRIVDVYLKNPFLSERKVEKLVGFSRGTVRRVIRKYKSITSNNEQTDESSQYYACEICGKLLKGKHSYNNHINLIHEKKKFRQCDICDRRFINKTDLKLHMKVHIPKEFRIKNLQCDHCDKSYDTKQNLKRHLIANHLKFKLHSCNLCEKSFHSEKSLKLHHVSHNKRNVQCDYPDCEKMFKSNKYMLRHKKVHMKELQVKCPYEDCNKSYAKKENLDLHIFVNHKKIREKCPVGNGCKFSVGRRDYMRAHLKKHSELSAGELEKYFKQLSTMNLYSK
ncbi:CLUMA_CG019621, isoform A [Clunio marinus]|uniref:CLUMA_CG019621, isoform A n=1 Tax=Clunio marinus TaxID=568069 RepID=A0A1J1J3C3_9DIPT|nr:CLUMA_CG019621, isoform A [Clunio marinus]